MEIQARLIEYRFHFMVAIIVCVIVVSLVYAAPRIVDILAYFWPLFASTAAFLAVAVTFGGFQQLSEETTGERLMDYVAGRSEDSHNEFVDTNHGGNNLRINLDQLGSWNRNCCLNPVVRLSCPVETHPVSKVIQMCRENEVTPHDCNVDVTEEGVVHTFTLRTHGGCTAEQLKEKLLASLSQ